MSAWSSEDELSQEALSQEALESTIEAVLQDGVTADELVELARLATTVEEDPEICFEWIENYAVTQMTKAEILKLVEYSEENSERATALHFLFGNVRRCIKESITVTGLLPAHRVLFDVDTLIAKLIERIQGFGPSRHVLDALANIHNRRD